MTMTFNDLAVATVLECGWQLTRLRGTLFTTLLPLSSLLCSVVAGLSLSHWSPRLRRLFQSWGFQGFPFSLLRSGKPHEV